MSVTFPVGSAVGSVECANTSISADGLVEADESFSITASLSSLDGYQPSETVEVIIRDDDGNDTTMHIVFEISIWGNVHFNFQHIFRSLILVLCVAILLVHILESSVTECMIPANQCRRTCDMRNSARKGTFKQNCYAYG